jgi:hypothetical protein
MLNHFSVHAAFRQEVMENQTSVAQPRILRGRISVKCEQPIPKDDQQLARRSSTLGIGITT